MSFTGIKFPADFEYSSDGASIPLEFYLEILPRSKVVYLKLGYFSSKAIQVLSYGFAQFICYGGTIKIISNHFLYEDDLELIESDRDYAVRERDNEYLLKNLEWINESLNGSSQHFMDCLKLLIKLDRLEIIPVMLRPGRMAHFKQGLFIDDKNNEVFMDGSCNFTANGLLDNAETISVFRSWGEEFERMKVATKKINMEEIINRDNLAYEYLDKGGIVDAVSSIGRDKTIDELLADELDLIHSEDIKNAKDVLRKYEALLTKKISEIRENPKFPYLQGPREYQENAYSKWLENGRQGIFAMATGTGKTITALNCLYNEYLIQGFYQAIILVPSKILLNQWSEEVSAFNFKNIFLVSSDHQWAYKVNQLNTGLAFDKTQSFIVIATYATFSDEKFQSKIENLPSETMLIADEAHNIGSNKMKALLPELRFSRRVALSATPKRRFDDEGNELIQKFFNSTEPYTYSFSMERAIREGILCKYEYHPHFVYLTEEEMEKYSVISKKLVQLFDHNSKTFRNAEAAKMLLLERRRIIHKASNKIGKFKEIVSDLMGVKSDLKYSFVYVPEGDDEGGSNLLDEYMQTLHDLYPGVKAHHYTHLTENRAEVMKNFEDGYVDTLFSMKCLDEGVDIPRAEIAIFCSSTGNPRQFIQRRGRVLRTHKDKDHAIIHDLVVIPTPSNDSGAFTIERNLIKEELVRVIYFASLAINYYESMEKFRSIADSYDLNIYALEQELKDNNDE